MAAFPEFSSFGEISLYSSERVAEEVIWPVVDEFSRRDWRKESRLGDQLIFQAAAMVDGEDLSVAINAEHGIYSPEGEVPRSLYVAQIAVEEFVSGVARSLAIMRVANDYPDIGEIEKRLITKSGLSFYIDTDGDRLIRTYKRLYTDDGELSASIIDDENDRLSLPAGDTDHFYAFELGKLATALRVLKAPKRIVDNLDDILNNPE